MNEQQGIISGSVFDDAVIFGSGAKSLQSRLPKIGQRVSFNDGSEFVFVSSIDALVAGEMVAVRTANASEIANLTTAAAIGADTVIVDITGATIFGNVASLAENRMVDGYIKVTDDAGEGYRYRVKSNTVDTTANLVTFTLYDTLKVALTAASDVHLIGPMFKYVVECSATLKPLGVCMVPAAGTSEYGFWIQVKGPAVCLGTATVGVPIAAIASGAVADASAATDNIVGTGLATSADGNAAVFLNGLC